MNRTDILSGIHIDRSQADCGTAGPVHIDADCSDTHPHLEDAHEWKRHGKVNKIKWHIQHLQLLLFQIISIITEYINILFKAVREQKLKPPFLKCNEKQFLPIQLDPLGLA